MTEKNSSKSSLVWTLEENRLHYFKDLLKEAEWLFASWLSLRTDW